MKTSPTLSWKSRLIRAGHAGQLLRKKHSFLIRLLFGLLGVLWGILTTRSPILARELGRRFFTHNDFTMGMRRASWYARRSWLGLELSSDTIFVFCQDMTTAELQATRRFLQRRQASTEPVLYAGDLSYVCALELMAAVNHPNYGSYLARYLASMNAFLATSGAPVARQPENPPIETREVFSASKAAQALADATALLKTRGFAPFILSGTLLGLIREGSFLPHDYDIDLGLMAEDSPTMEIVAALQTGDMFHITNCEDQIQFNRNADGALSTQTLPVMIKFSHENGTQIDIFIHHREGQTIWHGSALFRWDNSDFDLIPYTLEGVEVLGPKDADRHLTENYGEWRVPRVAFHSALHTPNQTIVRNPLSAAIFVRRYWLARQGNPELAAGILKNLIDSEMVVMSEEGPSFNTGIFAL